MARNVVNFDDVYCALCQFIRIIPEFGQATRQVKVKSGPALVSMHVSQHCIWLLLHLLLSQEMELLGEREEPLRQIEFDSFAAMRAFYVELATYVNVSHAAQFGPLVSRAGVISD